MVIETWLKTDRKKPIAVKALQGNLFSADNGANLIGVEVVEDGSPATLSGGVIGYVVRADGATVVVNGTLSDNKATVTLPASCYTVVGPISIVIKVGTTTVGACTGYVYRSSTDEFIDPGHIVPSLQELLAQIQNCIDATASANTAAGTANTAADNVGAIVASPFDESTVYVPGNYVTYNGNLYLITADHAAGDTWANTSKTQRNVGNELSNLQSALLLLDDIPDTVQTLQRNEAGKVSGIVHTSTASGGGVVRTDSYVFSDSAVVETRTLASGESLTITVNKATKVTTLVYAAA